MQLAQHESVNAGPPQDSLSAAIQQARGTISTFFRAIRIPRRTQTDFRIQAVFEDGHQREHLWLADLDFRTRPATGIVCERPTIKTVSYRKRVPFRPDQVSDWMYLDNGRVVGAYANGLLRRDKPEPEGLLTRLKLRFLCRVAPSKSQAQTIIRVDSQSKENPCVRPANH